MQPRELLAFFKRDDPRDRPPVANLGEQLALAQLEVLVSIDDRLARLESRPAFDLSRIWRESSHMARRSAADSVPMSALAEPAFDPLRDCEQDQQDVERMGLADCPECGEPRDAHRERSFGEPPDQPGSDAT